MMQVLLSLRIKLYTAEVRGGAANMMPVSYPQVTMVPVEITYSFKLSANMDQRPA